MKKILFGSTALAVAAVAAPSFAGDVELGLGGYVRAGVAFSDFAQGGSAEAEEIFHVIRDGEIHFSGRGTLDNGITIDTRVELEAFTVGDQIDENWLRIRSQFGAVLIGANDDAAYNAGYVGFTGYGVPNFNPYDTTLQFVPVSSAAGAQFTLVGGSDRISVQYYTPTIAGFSAGVSYAPDSSSDGGADAQATGADNDDGELAFGASYRNSFGDIDFAIGGGYLTGIGDSNLDEFGIGVEVGLAGFTVYGRYEEQNPDESDFEAQAYTAGVSYGTGPWTFGGGFAYQEAEDGALNAEALKVQGGVSYKLGDGVTAGAAIEYGDVDSDFAVDADVDGESAVAGALLLGVSF